jgi:hypothetical protein
MKTKQMLMLTLLLLGISQGREAQAFYNPSVGRWLSRDPIAEPGFEVVRSRRSRVTEEQRGKATIAKSGQMLTIPLYSFNRNDGVNKSDLLGLKVISSTCTEEQRKQVEEGINTMCNRALSPGKGCCDVVPEQKKLLQKICKPNYKIVALCLAAKEEECVKQATCAGVDPLTSPWDDEGGIIYFCPRAWGAKPCGTTLDCIVIHELLHAAGLKSDPNFYIQTIEKCVGCKQSYK